MPKLMRNTSRIRILSLLVCIMALAFGPHSSSSGSTSTGDLTRDLAKSLLSNSPSCVIDRIDIDSQLFYCLQKNHQITQNAMYQTYGVQWQLLDAKMRSEVTLREDAGRQLRLLFPTPRRATIDRVTGITGTPLGPDTRQVDFMLSAPESPTTLRPCVRANVPQKAQALFRKYDDGWRVEHVNYKMWDLYVRNASPIKVTQDYANTLAILQTDMGDITLKFHYDKAPRHVESFVDLAAWGFYDGTIFHRVIPSLMIQGGDPLTKEPEVPGHLYGSGGYVANGKVVTLQAEFNDTPHKRGVLSMARGPDPNSASSQFFIVVKDSPFLDHQYTAFGEVVAGMEVADRIAAAPRNGDRPNQPIHIKKVVLSHS